LSLVSFDAILEAQQTRKTKVAVMIFVLMPIRWTLPRFRYAGDAAGVARPVSALDRLLTGLVLIAWGNR